MEEETLKHIEEQIGLKLKLDPYFTGVRINELGKKYFNVELKEHTWLSLDYTKLERFAKKHKSIRVELNGYRRVAIFPIFLQ